MSTMTCGAAGALAWSDRTARSSDRPSAAMPNRRVRKRRVPPSSTSVITCSRRRPPVTTTIVTHGQR